MVFHIEGETLFQNKVLRRIFGPNTDKIIRAWRKLCNEELSDTYSSSNIRRVKKSRRMGIGGNVESMREKTAVYRGLLV
jgi:hypothetical protein